MFFLFLFITLLIVVGIAIHTSRIGIDIENLIIDTEQPKEKMINEEGKIYVYLLLFGKVKLLKKNVRTINKEDLKFKKPNFKINYIELVRNTGCCKYSYSCWNNSCNIRNNIEKA